MITVSEINCKRTETGARLRATVECKGTSLDRVELWFEYPAEYSEYISKNADPWIAALLMPAMRLGRTLKVEAPASAKLLEGAGKFMEIMHTWAPEYKQVNIETLQPVEQTTTERAVGAFFSGGVDSFYTVLKNQASDLPTEQKITKLLFVRGFDIGLQNDKLYEMALKNAVSAAQALGYELIVCSTNIKEVLCHKFAKWEMYFGSALISIALGIESFWKTVYIAAGLEYSRLIPGGSHPLIDPLWSTESMSFIYDGAEATRIKKVLNQISKSDIALKHLRTCWENLNGEFNCGRCEKCIRTMLNLEIAGVLGKCCTFSQPLRYSAIRKLQFSNEVVRLMMQQNYDAAVKLNCDPKLIQALKDCLNPGLAQRFKNLLWSGIRKITIPIDNALLAGRLKQFYHKTTK